MLKKIISGGQTGVDRAALDVGIALGIPIGGSCPKGRRAEDGPIDLKYPLEELKTPDYKTRTYRNVADSDGTLILYVKKISGGTALTKKYAQELKKPLLLIDLNASEFEPIEEWIRREAIQFLNIAGPRESKSRGVYQAAYRFLISIVDSAENCSDRP